MTYQIHPILTIGLCLFTALSGVGVADEGGCFVVLPHLVAMALGYYPSYSFVAWILDFGLCSTCRHFAFLALHSTLTFKGKIEVMDFSKSLHFLFLK